MNETASEKELRPRGREAVQQAVIEATEKLCLQRSPFSVTTQQIADEANVNQGLIHRYFGSKDAVLAATVQHVGQKYAQAVHDAENIEDILSRLFDAMMKYPTLPRIVVPLMVDNFDTYSPDHRFPVAELLIKEFRSIFQDDEQARVFTVLVLTTFLGWTVVHSGMKVATGLPQDDSSDAAFKQTFLELISNHLQRFGFDKAEYSVTVTDNLDSGR